MHIQKMPMLRVHDGCVSRTEAEEGCIEHRDVVEHGGALDVIGLAGLTSRPGCDQFSFSAVADGLDASRRFCQNSTVFERRGIGPPCQRSQRTRAHGFHF